MLSDNTTEFTKENIDLYFKELSKEYKRLGGRNTPVEIVLIGGAAIIENYGFRNMTTDIDAIIPAMGIMKEAIVHVGDKFGLPNGWLNADFTKTSSYSSKLTVFSKPYRTFNQVLHVRYVTGEYLIAMKLKSGRQYKNDLSDIVGILDEHEKQKCPITKEAISKAVNDLYGGWAEIDEKSVAFINAIMDNQRYEEIYAAIRENEQETKSLLIDFQEKYPEILNEKNIDSVIENSVKKCESVVSVREILENTRKQQIAQKQRKEKDQIER